MEYSEGYFTVNCNRNGKVKEEWMRNQVGKSYAGEELTTMEFYDHTYETYADSPFDETNQFIAFCSEKKMMYVVGYAYCFDTADDEYKSEWIYDKEIEGRGISFDYDTFTLTLENVNEGVLAICDIPKDITIVLKGKNKLNGIHMFTESFRNSKMNLSIKSDGSLEIVSSKNDIYAYYFDWFFEWPSTKNVGVLKSEDNKHVGILIESTNNYSNPLPANIKLGKNVKLSITSDIAVYIGETTGSLEETFTYSGLSVSGGKLVESTETGIRYDEEEPGRWTYYLLEDATGKEWQGSLEYMGGDEYQWVLRIVDENYKIIEEKELPAADWLVPYSASDSDAPKGFSFEKGETNYTHTSDSGKIAFAAKSVKPDKPTVKLSTSKGKLKVTISDTFLADGYIIYYSKTGKTGSYKKLKTVSKGGKQTYSKTLESGKYYIKVKPYRTVDGKKVYGSTSKAKSITIK